MDQKQFLSYLENLTDEELIAVMPCGVDELKMSAAKMGDCPIIPHRRQREFLEIDSEEVMYGGAVGSAKGLLPGAGILTPWGFKPLKDLKVGSSVCATDGTVTKIIGYYPRGIQECYRLKWHDGTETVCDREHIWSGWITGKARKVANKSRNAMPKKWYTHKVVEWFGSGRPGRFAIPVIEEPVRFNVHGENRGPDKHISRSIHPYVLGVLLGHGGRSGKLYTSEAEVVESVRCHEDVESVADVHRIAGCEERLLDLGLTSMEHADKFIPRIYQLATVEDRWELLRGLMDTDGHVEEGRKCCFTTVSKRLADGVEFVARSLGAIVYRRTGIPSYTHRGKKHHGRLAHYLTIKIPGPHRMFSLPRKAELCGEPQNMAKYLVGVDQVSDQETICIEVEHPNSLFITDGFVVTHNTEALQLWLAEGVKYDNFSGLFLRRTRDELEGTPTSALERSRRIFKPMGGTLVGRSWKFPNGAMVTFDAMYREGDKHKFDGHEYHRIVWDQVEAFSETQYTYMFSRLRRVAGYPIGCGMRSSANPIGGTWVKKRFVSDEAIRELSKYTAYDESPEGMVFKCPGTDGYFVPARISDNPSLEVEEYIGRLSQRLSPELAAKLANGDWSVREGAIFDGDHLHYYSQAPSGSMLILDLGLGHPVKIYENQGYRFCTIDTAGTSEQKAKESKGHNPSWSVCAVWDFHRIHGLFLRHIWRKRVGWPELKTEIQGVIREWGPKSVLIENAHHGQVLHSELRGSKLLPTKLPGMISTQAGAKYDRVVASKLPDLIRNGRFWLPDAATVPGVHLWLSDFESEFTSWTGTPQETADQIDVCSYAAYHVNSQHTKSWGGVIKHRGLQRG